MLVLLSTRDPDPILTPFIPIFFLLNWRDFHEHFQLEISSKRDIKAENSSRSNCWILPCVNFIRGERAYAYGRWDLMPTSTPSFIRIVEAAIFFYDRGRLGRGEIVTLREPLGYPLGTLWVGVRAKEGKRGGGWLTRTISSPFREFQRGASRRAPFERPKKTPTQQAWECCCRISPRPSIGLFFS